MQKHCLALDLKDDPTLINEYIEYHKNVWPEILKSIEQSGITKMEINRFGNRLFMIMETDDSFSFERKARMDQANAKVQDWEELMWKYQDSIPGAKPGEKWVMMEQIFSFEPK